MRKNNISLATLDEYAKRLSKKHVNMLYESKMHKSYSKRVFESSDEIFDDNFVICVSNDEIETAGYTPASLINNTVKSVDDVQYKPTETGIYFYTMNPESYDLIKTFFGEQGVEFSDVTVL